MVIYGSPSPGVVKKSGQNKSKINLPIFELASNPLVKGYRLV
jgi:hypothetical protein